MLYVFGHSNILECIPGHSVEFRHRWMFPVKITRSWTEAWHESRNSKCGKTLILMMDMLPAEKPRESLMMLGTVGEILPSR